MKSPNVKVVNIKAITSISISWGGSFQRSFWIQVGSEQRAGEGGGVAKHRGIYLVSVAAGFETFFSFFLVLY